MDKPSVTIVDLRSTPITHITPTSIVTADKTSHAFDIIALATGFDSSTGGLKDMNIHGPSSLSLTAKWTPGTFTAYGITTHSFPNFFFLYGPQAPTAYANGPSITEPQGDWILHVLHTLRSAHKTRINAKLDAERRWRERVFELHKQTLKNEVDGWYMGSNIPGKPREPLSYAGGTPEYLGQLWGAVEGEVGKWKGFEVS